MRLNAWLWVLVVLAATICQAEGGSAAARDDSELVTVTVTAVLTAKGHFSDGTATAADELKLTLTETSVYRNKAESHELLSSQHNVVADGTGKLVLGEDLPTPTWAYVPDNRDANPYSSVGLDIDGIHGVLSLRDFTGSVKRICELPDDGLTSSYPIAPGLAAKTFSDYALKHPIGDNHLDMMLPFAFPPNSIARKASGQVIHEFTEESGSAGTGKLIVDYTVTIGTPAVAKEKPKLKAVPTVPASVKMY